MREESGKGELPLDVRRRANTPERDAALVEAVLDAVPFPTVLLDPHGVMLLGNRAWNERGRARHGERFRTGVGRNYYDESLAIQDGEESQRLMRHLRELARGERTEVSLDHPVSHTAQSETRWYHIHASRVDEAGHVVVTHVDISSRVTAERTAHWRARHDHLTELPNRAHLHELIDGELARGGAPVSVLFLDVDGFKDVNDSLGHEAGDELLRQVADRLSSGTRVHDTVGRLGGDEFVVLCRDCDGDGAEALAERFRAAFDEPFDLSVRQVRLTVSIGIASVRTADLGGVRSTDLVRDADLAMYAAKSAGRNRIRTFTTDLREAVQRKVRMAVELRDAIEGDQLVLHYQPIVHLVTREVTGMEALVRWQHPERGLVPPDEFLRVAEQYELMDALTRWVLAEGTRQAAEWQRAGLPLVVGINVSATTLADGTLVDDVRQALAASGLPPELLVVELTETTVAEDPERAAAQFAALRISGVEVSIDDFGSGFSSLGQLVNIPAGVLKIDRSLVGSAEDRRSQSAAAIAAVVALAGACGMRALAEGVETAAQLAMAEELGCTFAQGYHIARPMPAGEVVAWVHARSGPRALMASL
ncbi:UNVERIFIED_ORG: EAL domain-containing protein [Bacillus sp. AZ43]